MSVIYAYIYYIFINKAVSFFAPAFQLLLSVKKFVLFQISVASTRKLVNVVEYSRTFK